MHSKRIFIACAATLALATPVLAQGSMSSGSMSSGSMAGSKTYEFAAQNGSGETGTVMLAPAGEGKATSVTIALKGAPDAAQPAHIHMGTCAKLDPKPAYALKSVMNGKSTSTVEVPMEKLIGGGFAVNVHKSANDIPTYVSCANLGSSMMKGDAMKGDTKMKMPAASASP